MPQTAPITPGAVLTNSDSLELQIHLSSLRAHSPNPTSQIRGNMTQSISQFIKFSMYHWLSCVFWPPSGPPTCEPPNHLSFQTSSWLQFYHWLCWTHSFSTSMSDTPTFPHGFVYKNTPRAQVTTTNCAPTVTSQSITQLVDMEITFLITWQTPD